MALITPILGELSGKLAGLVFAHNRGGQYVRQFTMPVNPNTQAQRDARASFGAAAQTYHALGDNYKAYWQDFALTKFNPKNGINKGQFTGMNAFVSMWHISNLCASVSQGTSVLLDDEFNPLACTFEPFAPVDTPPEHPLEANIYVDGHAAESLNCTISSVAQGGGVDLLIKAPVGDGNVFGFNYLQDAMQTKYGLAVFASPIKKQAHNFTKNPGMQLIGVFPPIATGAIGMDAMANVTLRMVNQRSVTDFKGFFTTGNVVNISVYAVTTNGMVACIMSNDQTIDPALPE